MRHLTVYVNDKEYNRFLELTKNLSYVKKIETDDGPTKEKIVNNIKTGLKEVQRFKNGNLKTTSVKDFLNELQH